MRELPQKACGPSATGVITDELWSLSYGGPSATGVTTNGVWSLSYGSYHQRTVVPQLWESPLTDCDPLGCTSYAERDRMRELPASDFGPSPARVANNGVNPQLRFLWSNGLWSLSCRSYDHRTLVPQLHSYSERMRVQE